MNNDWWYRQLNRLVSMNPIALVMGTAVLTSLILALILL